MGKTALFYEPIKGETLAIPIEWLEQEIEHAKEFSEDTSFAEYCVDLWIGKTTKKEWDHDKTSVE